MHRTIHTRPLLLAGAIAAAAAVPLRPATLAAQGPSLFEAYAARKEQSSAATFGGIALTGYRGPVGLRVGGALNLAGDDGASGRVQQQSVYDPRCRCRRIISRRVAGGSPFGLSVAGWTADVDLLFEPLRPVPALKSLLLGFSPYAFAGIGGQGLRPATGADTTRATVSYGGGLRHLLLGALGVGAEARYRQPLDNAALVTTANTLRDKVEYRVALSVGFGGGRRTPRPARDGRPAAPAPLASALDVGGVEPSATSAAATAPLVSRVLDVADGFVDTPYHFGGASPDAGFDGAGFVQYVFAQEGVRLPRTARQMAAAGAEVSLRVGSLRPGDLLLFANDGSAVDHVAIYVGRERIIHASASGQGVRYDVLGEGERGQWFAEHLVAARRIPELARPSARPRTETPRAEELDRPDRAPKPPGGDK